MDEDDSLDNLGGSGTLLASAYRPLARYIVKFIQAYERQGIPIDEARATISRRSCPRGLTTTQVTRGNINHVRKGDYAFMMPLQIGQRKVILSQFVLYKSMPFRQFNPAAIR